MEELFRFSITRAASRSDAATLPLEQGSRFQMELAANAPSDADTWQHMYTESFNYIKTNLTPPDAWILDFISQAPAPPVPMIKQLLSDLQGILPDASSDQWQAPIKRAASIDADSLHTLSGNLGDLFLALLVVRSLGPAAIDRRIRTENANLVRQNLPPLPPEMSEVLQDRPSLDELANLLRAIDLLTTSAALTTASDVQAALTKTLVLPRAIFSRFEKPIHAVGFTDLLVVKQHIARYELGEVARIENILKGESRGHTQKHTLSNERDTVVDTSTQTETDQELTTTDHVSLQNEIENTLKEDTKVDAGVHVQYDGKPVKAQVDLTVGYDRSSSESKKFASNLAKDITQKAAKKVTQKVEQTITTKIIETFEETEDQAFDNKPGPGNVNPVNISGVYQWVEKVYLAQVFNYGRHMLFDIMVPEPAASLLFAAGVPPQNQTPPRPPDPLEAFVRDHPVSVIMGPGMVPMPVNPASLPPKRPLQPSDIKDDPTSLNFCGTWIAKYQVTGVEPPPPETITMSKSFSVQAESQYVHAADSMNIEDGYAASLCDVAVSWTRSSDLGYSNTGSRVDVIVGNQVFTWLPQDPSPGELAPGEHFYKATGLDEDGGKGRNLIGHVRGVPLLPDPANPNAPQQDANGVPLTLEQRSVGVAFEGVQADAAAANIEVTCRRTPERFAKWQLETYDKIVTAWQKLQADYEEKASAIQFQKGSTGPLGAADPETNRQVERRELKRSCVGILSNDVGHINGFNALVPTLMTPLPPPPQPSQVGFAPDPVPSEAQGAWVRWFEQAFEWDKIGYVFYPYYWGRNSEWINKLNLKNDDPLFLNFLQAGYARVVVPVRNGFELAVNFYLLTGLPWMGGGLPSIWDKGQNPLYLSIVEEIKEQSGAPGNEKPVGDPWEIRLPTTLIRLRVDDKLPMWKWDQLKTTPPPGTYPPPPSSLWSWSEDKASEKKQVLGDSLAPDASPPG